MRAFETSIDARDVEIGFAGVLERVAAGEDVLIVKDGRPVARLTQASEAAPTDRRAAIDRMRLLANRNRLDGLIVRDLIAEGRK